MSFRTLQLTLLALFGNRILHKERLLKSQTATES